MTDHVSSYPLPCGARLVVTVSGDGPMLQAGWVKVAGLPVSWTEIEYLARSTRRSISWYGRQSSGQPVQHFLDVELTCGEAAEIAEGADPYALLFSYLHAPLKIVAKEEAA